MTRFGYVLSSEEWGPEDLVWQSIQAQQAGFESLGISDHFHPWIDEQGQSPFVWGVLGAISREVDMAISTHVTAPIMRIHPVIVAQAAATASLQFGGDFALGVGTGEALNEQILGDLWPLASERLEMLEEAVEIMRKLWSGDVVTHHGKHYAVEWARLYTAPTRQIPVHVSAFGSEALELAGRIGDGLVTTAPDREAVETFGEAGRADRPTVGATKVCYGPDRDAAVETAHRLWPNTALPGQLAQDLRTPAHFMQASSLVPADEIAAGTPCGPDLDVHRRAISQYVDAGFEEVLIHQIGPRQNEFFRFAADELLPALRED